MAIELSKQRLKDVLGAVTRGSSDRLQFHGVATNLEEVRGGELFIGISAEPAAVSRAFELGVALALTSDAVLVQSHTEPERILLVDDLTQALTSLARWWLDQRSVPVYVVTGTLGKTTLKDALARILLQEKRGCYTLGTKNETLDILKTICHLSLDDTWLLLEVAETALDAQLAQADVLIITETHIAECQYRYQAYLEALSRPCQVVYQEHAGIVSELKSLSKGKQHISWTSVSQQQADFQVLDVVSQGLRGVTFSIKNQGQQYGFKTSFLGEHNGRNVAHVIASLRLIAPHLPWEQLVGHVAALTTTAQHLEIYKLPGGRYLVDDTSDASMASFRAMAAVALDPQRRGTHAFIVGDVLAQKSLQCLEEYEEVKDLITASAPALVVAVGSKAAFLVDQLKKAGIPGYVAASPKAAAHVARKFNWEVLFVKGPQEQVGEVSAVIVATDGEVLDIPDTLKSFKPE